MKKIIAMMLALVMALSFVACGASSSTSTAPAASGSAPAADPIHLSIGHSNNLEHHYQVLAESFKAEVEAKTNGAIIIDIFPAEQLGSGKEMLESVKSGTQDIVIGPDAYLANYDPIFNVIQMPYTVTSWDQVRAIPGSEVAKTLEAAAENMGVKIIGWAANGMRVFTSNKEINNAADVKGMKIRCGSASLINDMLTALGAQPTSLSMSEVYSGIQTGMVDGQENPTANAMGYKLYEVNKFVAVTHHQYVSQPLAMNLAKFNSLTAEQQQIILDAAKAACAVDVDTVANGEEADLEAMKAEGVTVTYPDIDSFKAILEPVTESYCEKYGEQFTTLLGQIAELGK